MIFLACQEVAMTRFTFKKEKEKRAITKKLLPISARANFICDTRYLLWLLPFIEATLQIIIKKQKK